MRPTQAQLDELVRRIVAGARPLRILLFGSAARGDMRPDSDLDVLVVVPDGTPRRATAQHLYPLLVGMNVAVDLVVATPADLERHGDTVGYVYRTALREAEELYAA